MFEQLPARSQRTELDSRDDRTFLVGRIRPGPQLEEAFAIVAGRADNRHDRTDGRGLVRCVAEELVEAGHISHWLFNPSSKTIPSQAKEALGQDRFEDKPAAARSLERRARTRAYHAADAKPLTPAALSGGNSLAVVEAYALGAATSLGLALLTCGRVLAVLKRSLSAGQWLRRGIGVAVLAGVAFVTTGWDTQLLSQMSFANTTSIEETLINWTGAHPAAVSKKAAIEGAASIGFGVFDRQSWVSPAARRVTALALIDIVFKETSMAPADAGPVTKVAAATKADLPVEGRLPGFSGAVEWLNSAPLTPQALRGKVVLVDFWTFNCFNCLNALPHVRAWAEKYRDYGLVVVGVHTPELAFERDIGNVRKALARLKIDYPVAVDNGYAIWKAFNNEYWPAAYFVDTEGRVRHHHFGEHDYENSERVIQQLLEEAGYRNVPGGFVTSSSAVP